jgi:hypothetical protein
VLYGSQSYSVWLQSFSESTQDSVFHTAGVPLIVHINLYRQEVLEDSQLPAFQVQIVQILAAAGGGRYREFDVVKKYC